ncbi:hypothetical protein N7478_008357 [Penicillium angulare]|uniref:uncharacterized protein n=1 Tax=Penicillium angulare TaxID=116970 RepID=UPI0025422ACC|nr:uncharacterized protein N7478_008357 [Penicillium angulare]KAJ5273232.1 hypothetical protein N7478_008357 [Penicillium angulare]
MESQKEEIRLSYVPLHDDAESSARARTRPLSSAEQVFLQSQVNSFWGTSWTWEILSCLSAMAFFVAIIVVLWYYDGRSMPDWPYGITLNAMISVFSTIMKASMAFIVAECLAQLKWSWFRGGNKLSDLAMLDAGSRGAMGSLRVLFRTVPRHLVTFGCLVLVLATATDPFVQQVMAVKERQIQAPGNSSIQRCNTSTYTDYSEGAGPGMNEVPLVTLGAIYSGLFETQTANSRSIMMDCPTGNCTFQTYQSLGFCSSCANITDSLKLSTTSGAMPTEMEYNYTLPNKFVFSTSINNMKLMNATANIPLVKIDTAGSKPIVNFTAISAAGYGVPPQISATECAIFFCVDTYEANVEGGKFSENRTTFSTSSNASSNVLEDFSLTPDTCYKNGTRIEYPEENPEDCTYNVNAFSQLSMSNSLSPLLEGTGSLGMVNRPEWSPKSLKALYGDYGNFTEINAVFQSLATTLTINARSKICEEKVNGTPWTDQSFVQVRWKWMILPGVLVLFSVIFLVITIVHTRDQYIWKSSPLALLFSQLLVDDPLPLKSNPTLRDMENTSRNMEVLLETTAQGVRLKTIPRS